MTNSFDWSVIHLIEKLPWLLALIYDFLSQNDKQYSLSKTNISSLIVAHATTNRKERESEILFEVDTKVLRFRGFIQVILVRHSLSKEAAHALVRAMIHCRLDYCNSVLSNKPTYVYNNLQSFLRTAARLVMKLPGSATVRA